MALRPGSRYNHAPNRVASRTSTSPTVRPMAKDAPRIEIQEKRCDRSHQVAQDPHERSDTQRGLRPSAVAWTNGCIEPDRENADEKAPEDKAPDKEHGNLTSGYGP